MNGTVVVNTADIILENMTIKGDLIIAQGVGDGDATLNNVKVEGNTVIRGGGINSFKVLGTSSLANVIVARIDGEVRIFSDSNAAIKVIEIIDGSDNVTIEGVIGSLNIQTEDVAVTAQAAKITDVRISAEGAVFTIDKNSTVTNIIISAPKAVIAAWGQVTNIYAGKTAEGTAITARKGAVITSVIIEGANIEIKGEGEVEKAEIKANDVKIDTVGTKTQVDKNVTGTTSGGKELAGGTSGTTTLTGGTTSGSTGGGRSSTPTITLSGASFNEEGTVLTFGCNVADAAFLLDGQSVTPVYENDVYTIIGIPMAQKEYTLNASKIGYTNTSIKITYTLPAVEVLLSEVAGVYYPLVWGANNYDLVPQPEVMLEAVGNPINAGITISTQGVLTVPASYKGTIMVTAKLASPALTSAPLVKVIEARAASVSFVAPVTSVTVPAVGAVTQQYSVTVKDQTGAEMESPITYSLKSDVSGVAITTEGLVTVASAAVSDRFTVIATVAADSTVKNEQAVTLAAAPARDVAIAAINCANDEAGILAILQNVTHKEALGLDMTTFNTLGDGYKYTICAALLNKNYALSNAGKASVIQDFDEAVNVQVEAQVIAKADGIQNIEPPAKDGISLTLPAMDSGYTVAIKTSSNTAIIATDGTVTPPVYQTTVGLVLTVTHTESGKTADTVSINVIVPAKTPGPAMGLQFAPESDSGYSMLIMDIKNDTYRMYFLMQKDLDPELEVGKIDLSKLCLKKADGTMYMLFDDTSAYTGEQNYEEGSYYVETATTTQGAISYKSTIVRIYFTQADGLAIADILAGYSGEIRLAAQDGWYDDEGTGGEKIFRVNYEISFSNTSSKPVLCYVYTDEDDQTTVMSTRDESGIDSLFNIDNEVVSIDLYSGAYLDRNIPTTGSVVTYTDMETLKASGMVITDADWTDLTTP